MSHPDRIYYSDSFLREFSATVVEAQPLSQNDREPVWRLALDRSAFYPTSGGQPFDTGTLTPIRAGAPAGEIPVEQVEEDDAGIVWHYVREPLAVGTRLHGHIDWQRRLDHMQQHSGQHLLSAVFFHELQAPTVSFHLGESASTIDIASGALAHHSVERIEKIANEIIGEDRSVSTRYVSRAEAQALLRAGRLRKLPDREGAIRLVEIADYDLNACGGTHVRATGQIGGLLLRRVENISRGVRIEFVCGLRAVRSARTDAALLGQTAALLSSAPADVPETVRRLLAEQKTAAKERQRLREELATLHAAQLVSSVPPEAGLRLIVRDWKDRDRDYIRLLASRTAAASPRTAVVFSSAEDDPARVFLARSGDLSFNAGQVLREALAGLGLRGGGSPDLAQGDVPLAREPELRRLLIDAIRAPIRSQE